jgi:hypothetical protein
LNNTDPPSALTDDQCTVAENVEFNLSTLGERRKGCAGISLPVAITGDPNIQAITFVHRHLPTTNETDAQLWVLGQHLTTQNYVLAYKDTTWHTVTPIDDIDVTSGRGYQLSAVSLHGKLFLAYRSVGGVNRLHVWDGTTLRRTGLAQPVAPAVATTGVGTYTGTRYFRVRYVVMSGSTVLRRSEPSDATTFVPGGLGLSARITKPATISESETHWEVEASVDNANFYRITRVVVGTTTYDDSTAYTPGYATLSGAVLSEDIGDYSLIHSGKFLSADQDRLVVGGSWENDALASSESWTPVYNDPGSGNDERIPTDTDNQLNLDGFEGGPLTFGSNPVSGYIWAFKRSHTYRLGRTGQRTRAYEATNLSKSLGALAGSVVEGVDQYGMACLYFLDPETGPCRTGGARIIQAAGRDILNTWRSINTDATIVCRALYYPESRQVHWWVASSAGSFPNFKIILQTNETREMPDGVRKGWTTATGIITQAYTACLFSDNVDAGVARSLVLKPFIGVSATNGYVLQCDTGITDNGTAFAARVKSKPFIMRGLLNKFGSMAIAILAKASASASVIVKLTRDFGLETKELETTLAATAAGEDQVIKQLRNLTFAQMYALQLEFKDPAVPAGTWEVNRLDMKPRLEEAA